MKEFEAKAAALLHLAKELVSDREVLAGDSFRVLTEDVMDILDPIGPGEDEPERQPEASSDGDDALNSEACGEVQYEEPGFEQEPRPIAAANCKPLHELDTVLDRQ